MLRSSSEGGERESLARFRFSSSANVGRGRSMPPQTWVRTSRLSTGVTSQQVLQYEMSPPGTCRLGGTELLFVPSSPAQRTAPYSVARNASGKV